MSIRRRFLLIVAAAAALTSAAAAQPACNPYWARTNDAQFSAVSEMPRFDDGNGPALYFTTGPNFPIMRRLRADGSVQTIHQGLEQWERIYPPRVLQDSSGLGLYTYGILRLPSQQIEYVVARWNGEIWHRTWNGLFHCVGGSRCRYPLVSADLGDGPKVYGLDYTAGGATTVVRKEGNSWVPLGTVNSDATSLHSFDLGDGPKLYLMGTFNTLNGATVRGMASWDGTQWTDLSTPGFVIVYITDAVTYDDGSGPALYAIGNIGGTGGPSIGLKRWLGRKQGWQHVGALVATGLFSSYYDIHVFDDGRGPALYMSGGYANINGVPVTSGMARYDANGWSALPFAAMSSYRLASLEMNSGPALIVPGCECSGPIQKRYIYQYVGCPNCYANCDNSTVAPILNVDDFTCFINKFAIGDLYANCDGSTAHPTLDINDFTCFISAFVQGCP